MLTRLLWLYCLPYRLGAAMLTDRNNPYRSGSTVWGIWVVAVYVAVQVWLVYTAIGYWLGL